MEKSIILDSFGSVKQKLQNMYNEQCKNNKDKEAKIIAITKLLEELDLTYLNISHDMNKINVNRAIIIGGVCRYFKYTLLHGQWTNWAEENLNEGLRTLEKFMAISEAHFAEYYSHLGIEKVYQLTRVQDLTIKMEVGFEELFEWAGLDKALEEYGTKAFEKAITQILNRSYLENHGLMLSVESLTGLTSNCGLLNYQTEVLSRLVEAKSEGADLDKTAQNVILKNGKVKARNIKSKNHEKNYDINTVSIIFIESIQKSMHDKDSYSKANIERLIFINKLINEFIDASHPKI